MPKFTMTCFLPGLHCFSKALRFKSALGHSDLSVSPCLSRYAVRFLLWVPLINNSALLCSLLYRKIGLCMF